MSKGSAKRSKRLNSLGNSDFSPPNKRRKVSPALEFLCKNANDIFEQSLNLSEIFMNYAIRRFRLNSSHFPSPTSASQNKKQPNRSKVSKKSRKTSQQANNSSKQSSINSSSSPPSPIVPTTITKTISETTTTTASTSVASKIKTSPTKTKTKEKLERLESSDDCTYGVYVKCEEIDIDEPTLITQPDDFYWYNSQRYLTQPSTQTRSASQSFPTENDTLSQTLSQQRHNSKKNRADNKTEERILVRKRVTGTALDNLLRNYPPEKGYLVVDVTHKSSVEKWRKLSPLYPHSEVPVYNSSLTSLTVQGIYEGLKNVSGSSDKSKLEKFGHTVYRHAKAKMWWASFDSDCRTLVSPKYARLNYFIRPYLYVLENQAKPEVEALQQHLENPTNRLVLLDENLSKDIFDFDKPISHAYLLKMYLEGNYPSFDADDEAEL